MKTYPPDFKTQIELALGDQSSAFFEALEDPTPVSILYNRHKPGPESLFEDTRSVPWCPHGFYLKNRPSFVFHPPFHAGAYYVMEASSMMLWQGLNTLFDSKKDLRVLDLCGAPGGKSMIAANFLSENSLLVVNEVNRNRYQVLKENVSKWGAPNVYMTNYDPARISLDGFFDCVIVDAPCSGEGLFRKTPEAINTWKKSNVTHCSMRQKRILGEAARLVRPGGYILYSTCTYNDEENISNTRYLSDNHDFTPVKLKLGFNTKEISSSGSFGYQCYPHLVEGEGFYISALRKGSDSAGYRDPALKFRLSHSTKASKRISGDWRPYLSNPDELAIYANDTSTYFAAPGSVLDAYLYVMQELPYGSPSLILGKIKGTDIVPHHNLALSNKINGALPQMSLSEIDAIKYLRKDSLQDHFTQITGWHLATYKGYILGWMKQTSQHLKNYFPTNLRIRKRG